MIYSGIPICSVCKVKANLHRKKCKKGKKEVSNGFRTIINLVCSNSFCSASSYRSNWISNIHVISKKDHELVI